MSLAACTLAVMGDEKELDELRQDLRVLAARVQRLEAGLSAPSSGRTAAPLKQSASSPSGGSQRSLAAPAQAVVSTWEQRIGSQLFNRVGIVAVLFAMAWFLKLAFDRNWIGPRVQIAIGLVLAAALMLWSERFRRKGYPAFSYTLKALGSGIAFLTLWASVNVYHLFAAPFAFLLMVAVTVTNAYLAWKQESEVLAAYALLGGLVTPALLSTGEDHEVFLFGYLLLLALGVLLLVGLRSWWRLTVGAFAGTSIYFCVWFFEFYHPSLLAATSMFVVLFFVVFSAAPLLVLRCLDRPSHSPATRLTGGAPLLITATLFIAAPLAIAGAAAVELYALASHPQQAWLRTWFALGLMAASILLSRLATSRSRTNSADAKLAEGKLSATHEALAASFLALSIWFYFAGCTIVLGWLAEALMLIGMALQRPRMGRRALGIAAVSLCFVTLLLLETSDPLPQPVAVVFNPHFATYLAAVAVFALALWLSVLGHRREPIARRALFSWSAAAFLCTIALNVTALWAVAFEIHHYWTCGARLSGNLCRVIDPSDLVYSHFAYSGWFMAYGAGLMAVGFLGRSAFVRWQALTLVVLAIVKVFVFDASQLSQGYRVTSFLALGVLLLAISFAYQRDWLALRRDT